MSLAGFYTCQSDRYNKCNVFFGTCLIIEVFVLFGDWNCADEENMSMNGKFERHKSHKRTKLIRLK
ncbi:hypothetical protein BTA51_23030 [Hahella sp. CCB-MM4]|nr:hypothetical protein BTA51_23030 [Hahella sp. CCB-MM4]